MVNTPGPPVVVNSISFTPNAHTPSFIAVSVIMDASMIVTVTEALLALQGSEEVRVRVTVPAAMSAGLGVYTAFSVLAFGVNVPPLPPDHTPVVALPLTVPVSAMVAPGHTDAAAVAVTTGGVFTVTVTVEVLTPQFASVAVSVRVILPVVVGVNIGVRLDGLLNVPPVELHSMDGFVHVPFSIAPRLT